MARAVLFFAIFALFLSTSAAEGVTLGVRMDDVNEPYTAYLQAVNGIFMLRHDGDRDGTIRFEDLPPGPYMLDVKFLSGHEIARTIRIPASVPRKEPFQLSVSRTDAFFARDLAEAANRVSLGVLHHEEELARMVRDFERALESDDAERAEEILAQATDLSPEAALAWNNLAAIRLQRNRVDEAIPLLLQAIRINENIFEGHINLARAYAMKNQPEPALRHARVALKLRPRHPNVLSMMAGLLFLAGRSPEAAPYLEELIELDPEHVCRPGLLLAGILQERGEMERAAEMVLAYVRLHPDYEEAQILEARAKRVLRNRSPADSRNAGQ